MATVAMGLGQFQRFLSCDLGTGLHTFGTGLHSKHVCHLYTDVSPSPRTKLLLPLKIFVLKQYL